MNNRNLKITNCRFGIIFLVAIFFVFLFTAANTNKRKSVSDVSKISSGKNIISINFDSVTVLNFSDYFSKIEILPLEKPISTPFDGKFWRRPTYATVLDGLSYSLEIDEKNGGYIISQSPWPAKFFFDRNGHFIRGGTTAFPSKEDTVLIPASVTLDYKGKTALSTAERADMDYWKQLDNQYVFPVDVFQGAQFIFVISSYMQRPFLSFYNKQTGRTATGIDLFSNGLLLPEVRTMNDNILYGMVDPWDLNSAIDTCFLTEESKKLLPCIHPEDNSVIVKYYAK